MFFSRNNRPDTIIPPIGDGTSTKYEEIFDPQSGTYKLVEAGKEDLFSLVQASKQETLVYNIIDRYQRGDVTALSQRVGQYMDVVGMPKNMMEAHAVMLDIERKFNALSPDVKSKFGNDVNVFIDTVSHSTPDKLQEIFGVSAAVVDNVEKGDDVNVEK